MTNSCHRYLALAAALCAAAACAAPGSPPSPTDTAGARQERAARADYLDKQKKLFEDKRIAADAPERESAAVLELPQEEADSPGAVKK